MNKIPFYPFYFIALFYVSACVSELKSDKPQCIYVKEWSKEMQSKILVEEKKLSPDSILIPVLEDYIKLRNEARDYCA